MLSLHFTDREKLKLKRLSTETSGWNRVQQGLGLGLCLQTFAWGELVPGKCQHWVPVDCQSVHPERERESWEGGASRQTDRWDSVCHHQSVSFASGLVCAFPSTVSPAAVETRLVPVPAGRMAQTQPTWSSSSFFT